MRSRDARRHPRHPQDRARSARADKLAVKLGGGENHRIGLYDMILIKDNHIDYAGGIQEGGRAGKSRRSADSRSRSKPAPSRMFETALSLGVERILLDNMSVEMMAEAVKLTGRSRQTGSLRQCHAGHRPRHRRNGRGFHLQRRADPLRQSVRCSFDYVNAVHG